MKISAVSKFINPAYCGNSLENVNNMAFNPNSFSNEEPYIVTLQYIDHAFLQPFIEQNKDEGEKLKTLCEQYTFINNYITTNETQISRLKEGPQVHPDLFKEYNIFNKVNNKLERYNIYAQNKKEFSNLTAKAQQYFGNDETFLNEINKKEKLFETKPLIVEHLEPLAIYNQKVNNNLKNSLNNVQTPNTDDMKKNYHFNELIGLYSPYAEVCEVSQMIKDFQQQPQDVSNTQQAGAELYKKSSTILTKIYDYDEKNKKYHLSQLIQTEKVPEFDMETFDDEITKCKMQCMKITSSSAKKLNTFFESYKYIPKTSPELETLLKEQEIAIIELKNIVEEKEQNSNMQPNNLFDNSEES